MTRNATRRDRWFQWWRAPANPRGAEPPGDASVGRNLRQARAQAATEVDAPGAGHSALHDPMVTPAFWDSLPASVQEHLVCRVVDELIPISQKHDIEGLEMGTE